MKYRGNRRGSIGPLGTGVLTVVIAVMGIAGLAIGVACGFRLIP